MLLLCGFRLIYTGRHGCVVKKCIRHYFSLSLIYSSDMKKFPDRGRYIPLVIYTCARYVFALRIPVDTALVARLCRPEVLSLSILMVVMYSYTALVIYSCARDVFALLIAVDTPPRSARLCRPEVPSLKVSDFC